MRLVIRADGFSERLKEHLRAHAARPFIPKEKMAFVEVVGPVEGDDDPNSANVIRAYENELTYGAVVNGEVCSIYRHKVNIGEMCRIFIDGTSSDVSSRACHFLDCGISVGDVSVSTCTICGTRIFNRTLNDTICNNCCSIHEGHKACQWTFHRLESEPGNSIFYGVELEIVISKDEPVRYCLNALKTIVMKLLQEYRWRPDFKWCHDGSLAGKGLELNFAPMTIAYYREHKEKFELLFKLMSEAGFRGSIDGNELAGIHVHRSNKNVPDDLKVLEKGKFESFNVLWYDKWFDFLVAWSGKSDGHFRKYSSGGYRLLSSKHGGNNGYTVEYRGYSSDTLLDSTHQHDCFKSLDSTIMWCEACCRMMQRPELLDMHPMEAVEHLAASDAELFGQLLCDMRAHRMSRFNKSCDYEVPISKYRLYELSLEHVDVKAFRAILEKSSYFTIGNRQFVHSEQDRRLVELSPNRPRMTTLYVDDINATFDDVTAITDNHFNVIHARPAIVECPWAPVKVYQCV